MRTIFVVSSSSYFSKNSAYQINIVIHLYINASYFSKCLNKLDFLVYVILSTSKLQSVKMLISLL
jgi:hypothetical protein